MHKLVLDRINFMVADRFHDAVKKEEDAIEINLDLSLGGSFGVKLTRSSSIASCLPLVRDDSDAASASPISRSVLARTSSLPVETEKEWRKRKELQSLRRLEAKRRRSEKQRVLKEEKEGIGSSQPRNSDREKLLLPSWKRPGILFGQAHSEICAPCFFRRI